MLGLKLTGHSTIDIANLFSTSPNNVYVRLHRLRSGFYDSSQQRGRD
jgi:hypothetical protein